jgi:hypothetical protein
MRIAGMRAAMPAFVDALLTPADSTKPRLLRIMLRSPERLPAEAKLALIAAAEQTVARRTGSPAWRQALGGGARPAVVLVPHRSVPDGPDEREPGGPARALPPGA